jgi:hypothetical protein
MRKAKVDLIKSISINSNKNNMVGQSDRAHDSWLHRLSGLILVGPVIGRGLHSKARIHIHRQNNTPIFSFFVQPCMKLLMFLSNELVGTIPLCRESITLPGYLGKMKRELQFKYASVIIQANTEPEFFVDKATSDGVINKSRKRKK